MASKEDIDAVPLARKERNLTEAEAIMEIETNKGDVIMLDWGGGNAVVYDLKRICRELNVPPSIWDIEMHLYRP
jgi:hypothetical protein